MNQARTTKTKPTNQTAARKRTDRGVRPANDTTANRATAPVDADYSKIHTLADIGLTPRRAFGLFHCSKDAAGASKSEPIRFRDMEDQIAAGTVRVLHSQFGFQVVILLDDTLEECHAGFVIGMAFGLYTPEGSTVPYAGPIMRTLGYMQDNGMLFDWVDIAAESSATFQVLS